VLFVQSTILTLWGFGFQEFANSAISDLGGDESEAKALIAGLPLALFFALIACASFGAGVFLFLRFIRPIDDTVRWKQLVWRGLVASAFGAVTSFIVQVLETVLRSVTPGPYPFGYSFTPSIDSQTAQFGLLNAFGGSLSPFVYDAPLVILAFMFLKLWFGAHPAVVAPKDRASASG
jgi:hypothetical protein